MVQFVEIQEYPKFSMKLQGMVIDLGLMTTKVHAKDSCEFTKSGNGGHIPGTCNTTTAAAAAITIT